MKPTQAPWNLQHAQNSSSLLHRTTENSIPFAARLAGTQSTETTPQLPPTPTPFTTNYLLSLLAKMRPEDNQTLLNLLDEGWYARNKKRVSSSLSSGSQHNARTTSTSTTGTTTTTTIPAIRPLDLTALRDHNSNSSNTNTNEAYYSSARSIATFTPSLCWETPRSYISAASSALPTTIKEVNSLDIAQVSELCEEAELLEEKARTARKLARQRLRRERVRRYGVVLVDCICSVCIACIAVVVERVEAWLQWGFGVCGAVEGFVHGIWLLLYTALLSFVVGSNE